MHDFEKVFRPNMNKRHDLREIKAICQKLLLPVSPEELTIDLPSSTSSPAPTMIPGQKRNYSEFEKCHKNGGTINEIQEKSSSQESTEKLESVRQSDYLDSPRKIICSPQDEIIQSENEEDPDQIEPQDNKRQKVDEELTELVLSSSKGSGSEKLLDKSMTDSEQSSVHNNLLDDQSSSSEHAPPMEVDDKIKVLQEEIQQLE